MPKTVRGAVLLAATLLVAAGPVWSQDTVRALTDSISYNVGDEVFVDLVFAAESAVRSLDDMRVTVRYAGENSPILEDAELQPPVNPAGRRHSTGYCRLWRIPFDTRTGRHEIDLSFRKPGSVRFTQKVPRAGAFVVTRKLVRIDRVELSRSIYTSGDPIRCSVALTNLSSHSLSGLRVEFSERYWPWIAPTHGRRSIDVSTIQRELRLQASQTRHLVCSPSAKAREVTEPVTQQYGVVVWDRGRSSALDIAFGAPVVLQPPGVECPKPYPPQYVFERPRDVNTRGYRQFQSPGSSVAIQFDRSHTMFDVGSVAVVRFAVASPVKERWPDISISARLPDPVGKEIARHLADTTDELGAGPTKAEIQFQVPPQASGIYHVVAELRNSISRVLASGEPELGVNPLPRSVLIFCAHEDDEGVHAGIIRSAVENRAPLNAVHLTSGDAGSCDRYYQQPCGLAEALHFGKLRMEEAQAALGYMGVPRDSIRFVGLPDGGLGQIWYHHREPSNPYRTLLLATEHATYEGLLRSSLAFARDAVLEAAKQIIRKFQPEAVYTGHPNERHVDHRTNNWFVVKAPHELVREGVVSPNLMLLVDQVYGPGSQRPPTATRSTCCTFLAKPPHWPRRRSGSTNRSRAIELWVACDPTRSFLVSNSTGKS